MNIQRKNSAHHFRMQSEREQTLIHTFYVYMSKCRQFKGLSTGMSKLTIPNHTIKLQLHRRGTSSFLEEKNTK